MFCFELLGFSQSLKHCETSDKWGAGSGSMKLCLLGELSPLQGFFHRFASGWCWGTRSSSDMAMLWEATDVWAAVAATVVLAQAFKSRRPSQAVCMALKQMTKSNTLDNFRAMVAWRTEARCHT